MIAEAFREQPFTCAIVLMYLSNVVWNLTRGNWGIALYWIAASCITVSATWLMGWKS